VSKQSSREVLIVPPVALPRPLPYTHLSIETDANQKVEDNHPHFFNHGVEILSCIFSTRLHAVKPREHFCARRFTLQWRGRK
jgi:hypothetical protein